MAPAAFKISMVAAIGSPNGQRKIFPLTVSDVANAYAIHPDGVTNNAVLNGSRDTYIVDLILSAAGTDTTQLELYLNGQAEGTRILNATSLGTVVSRPLNLAPVRVPAGAQVLWKQLA